MMKKTFLRGVSVIAVVAMMLGIPSGVLVNAAGGTSVTYDFNNTAWHTTTTGNDTISGFYNINCEKTTGNPVDNIGVFPYTRDAESGDYAVQIKSTTDRDGTGLGLDYGEDKTSGFLESEFDLYLSDLSVTRSFVTRAAKGGTSITTIASISTNGKLTVKGDTSNTSVALEQDTWYRVRIYYAISSDISKGGATTVDVYRDGVCIGHMNGVSDVPTASTNYSGAVRYICLTHSKNAGSTVIDNWSYAYSETNDYLYREFDSDFETGAYIGGTQWGGGDNSAKTYTQGDGDYTIKSNNASNYFNAEYTLTAKDYFKAANNNSIAVDFTVNFPEFNTEKKFIIRGGTSGAYGYGVISATTTTATGGKFSFGGRSTSFSFATNTDYAVSFRYNLGTQYGCLTISQNGNVVYDSSKDMNLDLSRALSDLTTITSSGAVAKVGFGIAKNANGESALKLKDLKIYEVAGDSFPTQIGIGFVDASDSKLTSLSGVSSIKVKLYGNVGKDFSEQNKKLLIAQYGENDNLLKTEIADILSEGSLSAVTVTPVADAEKVRAFVWDMNGIQPICQAASLQ